MAVKVLNGFAASLNTVTSESEWGVTRLDRVQSCIGFIGYTSAFSL